MSGQRRADPPCLHIHALEAPESPDHGVDGRRRFVNLKLNLYALLLRIMSEDLGLQLLVLPLELILCALELADVHRRGLHN